MSGSCWDSWVNSRITNSILDRLSSHIQLGYPIHPLEFCHLCLYLSKGIDYALSYGQIPDKARHLPTLMKKIFQQKNDELSQAAITVLMISIKNACKIGWFQTKESEELFSIADEMGKIYCNIGNVSSGPSSCHSIIPTIMERFYPKMKLGQILLSIEAKPEYGAATADFHVTKSTNLKDKIWLLVAQIDNIETSACLISPQQVNFLLNGKGVDYRTNVRMATGPQMPTDVTGMLKYGSNLLQAVGQFNGHYVIIVAYMSVTSLLEHPVLQDYVQPTVTSVDSDSDIIEGSSQISLNCPISFTRIKTPVKGRTCRHFQCFDFDNFIHMNSRRPSWRCPHCNQSVSYADICLDRNMVEVLKDVGENIVEVIFHADGSWKAVLENYHNVDKMQNKGQNCQKEQTEPRESTLSPSTVPNVLDLTNDDDRTDIMDTFEAGDRKIQASVDGQVVSPNSTSLGLNSVDVNRNVAVQIEDEFLSGLNIDHGWPDTPTVGGSEQPALPDTVSPAFNQEAEGNDNNSAINSVIHNQFSTPNNSQLQLNYNSAVNEYGMSSSVPRHISRIPVIQALPVQPQALQPQQNSRTNLNSLPASSSPATPHAMLSDTERRQYFSQPPMNLPQFSGANSSALQYHSVTQNRVQPAPGQLQNLCRASGLLSESRNSNLQQAPNPLATADNHQGRLMAAASFRGLTGGQRGNVGAPLQSVSRPNDIFDLQSEQNWRHPTPRMRGSLAGKQLSELSDDVRQQIIMPTQPVQSSRPQGLLQPFQPNQPIRSSRPQGLQPVQPTQSVQILRPQGLPQSIRPTQPAQSLRPQGPQPVQPTQLVQTSKFQATGSTTSPTNPTR